MMVEVQREIMDYLDAAKFIEILNLPFKICGSHIVIILSESNLCDCDATP